MTIPLCQISPLNKKSPGHLCPRDELTHSRYHPACPPPRGGKPLSDSNKSTAGNGAHRTSLLTRRVQEADSGIRLSNPSAPAHTSRRLSGALGEGQISVNVILIFRLRLLKHKIPRLSTSKFFCRSHRWEKGADGSVRPKYAGLHIGTRADPWGRPYGHIPMFSLSF